MFNIRKHIRVLGSALVGAALYSQLAHAQTAETTAVPPPSTPEAPAGSQASAEGAVNASPPAVVDQMGQLSSAATPTIAGATADVDISAYAMETAAAAATDEGPSLSLYGFADFSVISVFGDEYPGKVAIGENPAFMLGNLNLYAAARLSERWRSLLEVRFTVFPDGNIDYGTLQRVSTASHDYANISTTTRWGGIVIERAWLEYSVHELLTIRAGSFLTPVGIWNVDHGSPTIIPALRPFIIGNALFPLKQTGFEVYGNRLFGSTTLGYHLTVSNGRGGIETYGDLDKNKALGGRLYATFTPLGTLTIGASGYTGRSTSGGVKVVAGKPSLGITEQFDELALGADLLWKWQGLHVQAELQSAQVRYTPAGGAPPLLGGPPTGVVSDHARLGGYALLAYRLPWLPLMPFAELEFLHNGGQEKSLPGAPNKVYSYGGGLNYRPIPSVTLKAQYYHTRMLQPGGAQFDFDTIYCQSAWSF